MPDDLHSVIRSLESRIAELEAERRPRRGIRLSRRLAVGLLMLVLLVPGVALASHRFTDVPDSHTFHEDIDWLADNGITGGCAADRFCPSSAVTRGQLAAFMHRLSNEFELATNSTNPVANAFHTLSATCPDDKRAIAGGGATSEIDLLMTDSWPTGNSTWTVSWESDNSTVIDPLTVQVWALCAPRL